MRQTLATASRLLLRQTSSSSGGSQALREELLEVSDSRLHTCLMCRYSRGTEPPSLSRGSAVQRLLLGGTVIALVSNWHMYRC